MVHLHNHTTYSVLSSTARIPDLVRRARELGQKALAITDLDLLSGVVEFTDVCRKNGIRPIYGLDLSTCDSIREKSRPTGRITLLARDGTGFSNLVKISSIAATEGFFVKPRCDLELLSQYPEGLICLSGNHSSDLGSLLAASDYEGAKALALQYAGIFGENYYIELQNHGMKSEVTILPLLVRLARELNLPVVATNEVNYVNPGDADAYEVVTAIRMRKTVRDIYQRPACFYLRPEREMVSLFRQVPEAVTNTDRIAEMCQVELPLGISYPPVCSPPPGWADGYRCLLHRGLQGLQERCGEAAGDLTWMLRRELETVRTGGFVDQVMLLSQLAECAREQGILVGPGCGDAPASLLLYCLGVTATDPLRCGLDPTGFLHQDTAAFPPLALELSPGGRRALLRCAMEKVPPSRMAQCMSFFTRSPSSAVRNTAAALVQDVNPILSWFPEEGTRSIGETVQSTPELKELCDRNIQTRKILSIASTLEGQLQGIQADESALLVAPGTISDFVPVSRNTRGEGDLFLSQTTAEDSCRLGLWRLDLRETPALAVLQKTLALVPEEQRASFRLVPLPEELQTEEGSVWSLLAEGEVTGVDPLDTPDLRPLLQEMKPETVQDLMAFLALSAPRRREALQGYIALRRRPRPELPPDLRSCLDDTWGEILYREQIVRLFSGLAGLSPGKARLSCEVLRNRRPRQIANLREVFLRGKDEAAGCLRRGISPETAQLAWSRMTAAAPEAVSQAETAAAAVQVLQLLWARLNFPLPFLAAALTVAEGERQERLREDLQKKGIPLLPVDINASSWEHTPEGEGIRLGLMAVSGISRPDVKAIEVGREKGAFRSLQDLINRCPRLAQHREIAETLIRAHACDSLEENGDTEHLLEMLPGITPVPARGRKRAGT